VRRKADIEHAFGLLKSKASTLATSQDDNTNRSVFDNIESNLLEALGVISKLALNGDVCGHFERCLLSCFIRIHLVEHLCFKKLIYLQGIKQVGLVLELLLHFFV